MESEARSILTFVRKCILLDASNRNQFRVLSLVHSLPTRHVLHARLLPRSAPQRVRRPAHARFVSILSKRDCSLIPA